MDARDEEDKLASFKRSSISESTLPRILDEGMCDSVPDRTRWRTDGISRMLRCQINKTFYSSSSMSPQEKSIKRVWFRLTAVPSDGFRQHSGRVDRILAS